MTAVEMHDVVKTFGATRALDGLDLRVGDGEVHGFLGPNGAGESTTIRVLLGLLRGLPGALAGVSPYQHLAAVPVEDFSLAGPAALLGTAVALVLVGVWGYRRRDALNG